MKKIIYRIICYSKQNRRMAPGVIIIKNFIKQRYPYLWTKIKKIILQQSISKMGLTVGNTIIQQVQDKNLSDRLYKEIEYRKKLRG